MMTMPLPFGLVPQYRSNNIARNPSPNVWKKFRHAIMDASGDGSIIDADFEDFTDWNGPAIPTASTAGTRCGRGVAWNATTGAIAKTATLGGVVRLTTQATADYDFNYLPFGDGIGGQTNIIVPGSTSNIVIFEARIQQHTAIASTGKLFVGLALPTVIAGADRVFTASNTTSVLESTTYHKIGFFCKPATPGVWDFGWTKAGITTLITGVNTAVVDTFYKLGFVYDPNEDTAHRIRVFVDDVEQATYGTGTQVAATTTMPSGTILSPLLSVAATGSAAHTLDCDWIGYAQLTR